MNSIDLAIKACKDTGIEQLYLISNSDSYTNVLKRKFGFKEASGKTLFLELDDYGE